jgi:hypothetical protein
MKTPAFPTLLTVLLAFVLLQTFPVVADNAVVFKPPQMGAPATRVGGGSRGSSDHDAQLQVLAPEQTALTSQVSPTLYWFISKASPAKVEITLTQGEAEPLLKKTISGVQKSGIQAISLQDSSVKLQPGQEYTLTVALVNNPEQRSGDVVSSAMIKYQVPSKPLTDVAEMADAGYWYDTLDKLVTTNSPQLAPLLKQVRISL